jgi:CubicO group peptidase (beta-lactamase class C family)
MKRPLILLAALLVFVDAGLSGHHLRLSASTASTRSEPIFAQTGGSSDTARIARIENGLQPPVTIQGHPPQTFKLADRMEHYKIPGVSIAFFERGRIVWTRTYGFADVASKKPVTPDTIFEAGSISKPTTALAALHLVQEGKLDLDQDVNQKLVSWKVPENEFTREQKVTLRRILSHSAGLTVHGFPGYATDETLPSLVQILNGEKPVNTAPIRVDVIPGSLWRYSGGGYAILQLLLIETTHQPFPQLLQKLVLGPAGMTHSTFEQPLPAKLWPVAATPYRPTGDPVKGGAHTYPEMAAAGLWTTPSDLAKMAIEVQAEYAGKSSKILSQQMMKQMLTVQKDPSGLGFFVRDEPGGPRFSHEGDDEGFVNDLVAYTAGSGQGVAIMTNGDRGGDLIPEVVRAIAKEYGWPDFRPIEHTVAKVTPAVLQTYVGEYEIPGVAKLTISLKDGRLFVQNTGNRDVDEMFPESETSFFILSQDLVGDFVRDDKRAVTKLLIHVEGQTIEAKKIS